MARRPVAASEWIFGARNLARTAERLAASGYDGLEIVGQPKRPDVNQLESLVDAGGIRVTGMTADSQPPEERDLAHPDRDLRRLAVAHYQGCVGLAARLNAPTIGVLPSAEGRLGAISGYQREWKLAVAAAREVAYFAGENGVAIAIEPLNRYEAFLVNRVEQALAFAEEVGVPNAGIVADLFHMNIEEVDPVAALAQAAGRLLEIHLADSNRRGLGHGHLPLERLLSAAAPAEFDGAYVMEFVAADDAELDEYLAESAVFLRRMLP